MRNYNVYVALAQVGASQVIVGSGLTASAAKAEGAKSIHSTEQVIKVITMAEAKPTKAYAVLVREGDELFLDRIEMTRPENVDSELVRELTL